MTFASVPMPQSIARVTATSTRMRWITPPDPGPTLRRPSSTRLLAGTCRVLAGQLDASYQETRYVQLDAPFFRHGALLS